MIDGVKIVTKNGFGVDSWDPYILLGVGKPSFGYDIGYICSNAHGKIKAFSFHKPYDINQNHDLTDAQIRAINCGLTFPVKGNITDIKSCFDGNMNGWVYTPPSSPYALRIDDFIGYTNNPTPLVAELSVPSTVYKNGSVNISAAVSQDEDSVKFSDLQGSETNLSDFYFGVLIVPTNGSGNSYVATSSVKMSNNAASVSFAASIFETTSTKAYTVYPFLSAQQISATTAGNVTSALNKFVPLPLVQPQSLTVAVNSDSCSVAADVPLGSNNTQVHVTYTVRSAVSDSTVAVRIVILSPNSTRPSGGGSYTPNTSADKIESFNVTCVNGMASGSLTINLPASPFQQALNQGRMLWCYMDAKRGTNTVYAWSMVAVEQPQE